MNETETIKLINEKIINDVVKLIGKEGCIGCYKAMKARTPNIYEYRCNRFGHDIIEYVNSL